MNFAAIVRGTVHVPFFLTLLASAVRAEPYSGAKGPSHSTSLTSASAIPPATQEARPPEGLIARATAPFREVMFDEPGDGALWVRGASYKARFDGAGATIVPFFGSDAPRNFPLELKVGAVTVGGEPLPVAITAKAAHDGHRVSIDRGSFVEEYDIALESLEQRFVFDALPGQGELVVRMNTASELVGSDLGASLRFENERGRVDYGEAFALDAAGRRIALDSTLVDGTIQLVVPADFVATATLPLTIDPFVTFFTVSGAAHYELYPDVSYDVTSDQWCVVWADAYSTSDYDVFARLASGNGTLNGFLTIDFTTDFWTTPRIANNNDGNVFLVVAAAVPTPVASNPASIRGRLIYPLTSTLGGQQQFSPNDGAYRSYPDVGGDPNVGGFSGGNFCVVWQRPVTANIRVAIEGQIVTSGGLLQGGVVSIDNSVEYNEYPRISKSLGRAAIAQPSWIWTVAWQRRVANSNHDIYGAQVLWHGGFLHPTFPIDSSFQDDTFPVPSTIMDPLVTFEERPYMVVYQRAYTDSDVIASVLKGNVLVTNVNLSGTFPAPFGNYDQTLPSVDCDGSHFLMGHVEKEAFPSTDTNVWISDYYLSGSTLVACATHQIFGGSTVPENAVSVCSMGSSGGPQQHFFGTWTYASINNATDIQGGLWDSCAGGVVKPFCFGDGSGTACPCGNTGSAGHGCGNSANGSGGLMTATGTASWIADTLAFQGSGMPPSSPCLYFQGTASVNSGLGSVFGGGILCVGGTTSRLGIVLNDPTGASSFPASGTLSQIGLVPSSGAERYYQIWHRDSASFCTGSGFSVTNGLHVIWSW